MNIVKLRHRCLNQVALTRELAGKLNISTEPAFVSPSAFESLKMDFESGPNAFHNEELLAKMIYTARTFEDYLYLFSRVGHLITYDTQNDALRAMARTAATFDENYLVFIKSVGRPEIVSQEKVLKDLALIGTFEDWLIIYLEHRNIFDYPPFHEAALEAMTKILKSEH